MFSLSSSRSARDNEWPPTFDKFSKLATLLAKSPHNGVSCIVVGFIAFLLFLMVLVCDAIGDFVNPNSDLNVDRGFAIVPWRWSLVWLVNLLTFSLLDCFSDLMCGVFVPIWLLCTYHTGKRLMDEYMQVLHGSSLDANGGFGFEMVKAFGDSLRAAHVCLRGDAILGAGPVGDCDGLAAKIAANDGFARVGPTGLVLGGLAFGLLYFGPVVYQLLIFMGDLPAMCWDVSLKWAWLDWVFMAQKSAIFF